MRIGDIVSTIIALYNNEQTRKRAVLLRGKSGVGKSDTIRQAAQRLGINIIDVRLTTCDATDMSGFPVPNVAEGVAEWLRPEWFPTDPESAGILLLDEITSAPPTVAAAAYQLVLDRQLGQHRLPDGWMVIGAGNRADDRGATYATPAPLLNRFTLLEPEPTVDEWLDHAASCSVRPEVMAFIRQRGDYLHRFDSEHYGNQFPTPRAWFAVSDKLALDLPPMIRVDLLKGDVGEQAAGDFEQFMRVYEQMPNIEEVFKRPEAVAIPEALDVRYCLVMGLAARVDRKTFGNTVKFLRRLPQEMETLCVKLAYQREPTIAQAPEFAQWAMDNQDAFKR